MTEGQRDRESGRDRQQTERLEEEEYTTENRKREREERERERERERVRERQRGLFEEEEYTPQTTERDTDRTTDRQTDRQTDRERESLGEEYKADRTHNTDCECAGLLELVALRSERREVGCNQCRSSNASKK
jgi:hypothetical protein